MATVIVAAIVGLPPTIAAIVAALTARSVQRVAEKIDAKADKTQGHVEKIEQQTNHMVDTIAKAARREGKAEVMDTLAVAVSSAPPAALPITLAPASNQAEIMRWIEQGILLEKARRQREGNGPPTP
jgi:hypothetical protein